MHLPGGHDEQSEAERSAYLVGASSSLLSAIIAGLLPVCTPITKGLLLTSYVPSACIRPLPYIGLHAYQQGLLLDGCQSRLISPLCRRVHTNRLRALVRSRPDRLGSDRLHADELRLSLTNDRFAADPTGWDQTVDSLSILALDTEHQSGPGRWVTISALPSLAPLIAC